MFRMLSLVASYNFDLGKDLHGTSLIRLLFKWDKNRIGSSKDGLEETMDQLRSGGEYKDKRGNTVQSMTRLLRWLAVEVGISLQHWNYRDLLGDTDTDRFLVSEEDFNAIKEEQLLVLTTEPGRLVSIAADASTMVACFVVVVCIFISLFGLQPSQILKVT